MNCNQRERRMEIPEHLTDRLPEMSGSETKVVWAMYSEGKPLSINTIQVITGMSRSTIYRCLNSENVKDAIKHIGSLEQRPKDNVVSELRKVLDRFERNSLN